MIAPASHHPLRWMDCVLPKYALSAIHSTLSLEPVQHNVFYNGVMSAPILATKLYVPLPRDKAVPRSRLIEQLNEGARCKLTLISAPAGFGKTTLLSEWLATLTSNPAPTGRGEFAWLSLDEGDSDPGRFLSYLIAALQTVAPRVDTVGEMLKPASCQRSWQDREPDWQNAIFVSAHGARPQPS